MGGTKILKIIRYILSSLIFKITHPTYRHDPLPRAVISGEFGLLQKFRKISTYFLALYLQLHMNFRKTTPCRGLIYIFLFSKITFLLVLISRGREGYKNFQKNIDNHLDPLFLSVQTSKFLTQTTVYSLSKKIARANRSIVGCRV